MSTAILNKLRKLRETTKVTRTADTERKNQVLLRAAALLKEKEKEILKANQKDLKELQKTKKSTPSAFIDRLVLNPERLELMATSLREVAALPDPVGEEAESRFLENGLQLRRVRAPLGVIFMIFESRPNVAIEAFSLAFKAGNTVILRGGKESRHSVAPLYSILQQALKEEKFPTECLWGITNPDRKIPNFLLRQRNFIDVVVPRGGDGLIDFVVKTSEIPIIKNDRGLCHVYVHEDADLEMATQIVLNGKTQRPGVCNSIETVLVHEKVAAQFIPRLYHSMSEEAASNEASSEGASSEATSGHPPVQWFCDPPTQKILKGKKLVKRATTKNWNTEYLDYKINCRVVKNSQEAMLHIEEHGSSHSEVIVTSSLDEARRFQNEVDAATVYWNASTRFTDGFEMGLGGELGISTQKLHVRGPVGLKELTSLRWIIDGTGQVRK